MASISSLGVGSGLDTATILKQLAAAEQTRLSPLTIRQGSYQSKISAWGQISDALTTLQGSAKKLSSDAFTTQKVSTNTAFTATAGSGALSGTHKVVVRELASSHSVVTAGGTTDDADKALGESGAGNRTVVISQGDGKETRVELKDDETSLNQIAKRINKEGGDVTASIVRSDDGYQLVLTSKTSGVEGEMTVTVEGDDTLGQVMNFDPADAAGSSMTQLSEGRDAKLDVDGIAYTRSSNNVTDILDGVTLTLNKVSSDLTEGEQLTLTQDTAATKTAIQDFVKNYNALLSLTSGASKWVENDASGLLDDEVAQPNSQNGALMGDSMLRGLVSEVRGAVNDIYGDGDADIQALADLGIKIDSATGQMKLDEAKLDKALADNPDQIEKMFVGSPDKAGLGQALGDIITTYVGDESKKIDGSIKSTKEGLDDQLKQVKTQIDKTQKLIDASVERYRIQFQNLDSIMSQLTSSSSSITAMLMQYSS